MTHDQRIFDLLETINQAPGLTAGQLLARCNSVNAKTFSSAIKDMHARGLIVTTGMKEKTEYHLTDSGRASLECGELPVPKAVQQDAEQETPAEPEAATGVVESTVEDFADIPVFGAAVEITAGADEVVLDEQVYDPPLKVFDTDKTTLDEALAQLKELAAEIDRPTNLFDLIEFNRRGAALVRNAAPVAAALMESSANALERAYCQQ
jgi:predicted transcriptional regulator